VAVSEELAQLISSEHYRERRFIVLEVVRAVAAWWTYLSRSDINGSWETTVGPGLVSVLHEAQRQAAEPANTYVERMAGEDSAPLARVNTDAFTGQTYDGRTANGLLDLSRQHTLRLIGEGSPREEALASGLVVAQRAAVNETQDAGRGADHVAMVTQPALLGYVRYLELPSCSRCVVLAGRRYRWSAGFERHPRCDCLHIPYTVASPWAGRAIEDPEAAVETGQVTGLSAADRRALEDGADLGRLVNAKKTGLSIAGDGTRKRGRRLTPEAIYKRAGNDRELALKLLRQNRYVL
jgi:hypothetical protein